MIASLLALAAAAGCAREIVDYAQWTEAAAQQWDYRGEGVVMIGAEHLRDPGHPQFAHIEAVFTATRPTLVLYEGPDRGIGSDAADTIRTRGESGYARYLAAGAGAKVASFEPSPAEQFEMLARRFPADQVLLFFTLREISRLRDRENLSGAALDATVAALLGKLGGMMSVALPFSDIAGLDAATRRYWPERDWRTLPADWFSPLADDARNGSIFTAAINRAVSDDRNHHIFGLILEAIGKGERVFVVAGRNHVPMVAPALDCMIAAPSKR